MAEIRRRRLYELESTSAIADDNLMLTGGQTRADMECKITFGDVANAVIAKVPKEVPSPTSSDAGKILGVNTAGQWAIEPPPSTLPEVTADDEGKVLTVDGQGEWIPSADYVLGKWNPTYLGALSKSGCDTNMDAAAAIGDATTASGVSAYAEGMQTVSGSTASHAEGHMTTASGKRSHAEGFATSATNDSTHAEGLNSRATGIGSHAEGQATRATGDYSHAEGNQTTASGEASHSSGYKSTASGSMSCAEGRDTLASGMYSHASGYGTIANEVGQSAIGRFNSTVEGALFIVGNGNSSADRSNAAIIYDTGNVNVAGDVTLHYDGQSYNVGEFLSTSGGDYMTKLNPAGTGNFTMNNAELHETNSIAVGTDTTITWGNPDNEALAHDNIYYGRENTLDFAATYSGCVISHNEFGGQDNKLTSSSSINTNTIVGQSNIISAGRGIQRNFIASYMANVTATGDINDNTILGRQVGIKASVSGDFKYNTVIGAWNEGYLGGFDNYYCDYNFIGGSENRLGSTSDGALCAAKSILWGNDNKLYATTSFKNVVLGNETTVFASNLKGVTIEGECNVISPDVSKFASGSFVFGSQSFHGTHIEGLGNNLFFIKEKGGESLHIEGRHNTLWATTGSTQYGLHLEGFDSTVHTAAGSGGHIEGVQHYIGYHASASNNTYGVHIEGYENRIGDGTMYAAYGSHIEGHANMIQDGSTAANTSYGLHIEGDQNKIGYGSKVDGAGVHIEGALNTIYFSGVMKDGVHIGGYSNHIENGTTAENATFVHGYNNSLTGGSKLNGGVIIGSHSTVTGGTTANYPVLIGNTNLLDGKNSISESTILIGETNIFQGRQGYYVTEIGGTNILTSTAASSTATGGVDYGSVTNSTLLGTYNTVNSYIENDGGREIGEHAVIGHRNSCSLSPYEDLVVGTYNNINNPGTAAVIIGHGNKISIATTADMPYYNNVFGSQATINIPNTAQGSFTYNTILGNNASVTRTTGYVAQDNLFIGPNNTTADYGYGNTVMGFSNKVQFNNANGNIFNGFNSTAIVNQGNDGGSIISGAYSKYNINGPFIGNNVNGNRTIVTTNGHTYASNIQTYQSTISLGNQVYSSNIFGNFHSISVTQDANGSILGGSQTTVSLTSNDSYIRESILLGGRISFTGNSVLDGSVLTGQSSTVSGKYYGAHILGYNSTVTAGYSYGSIIASHSSQLIAETLDAGIVAGANMQLGSATSPVIAYGSAIAGYMTTAIGRVDQSAVFGGYHDISNIQNSIVGGTSATISSSDVLNGVVVLGEGLTANNDNQTIIGKYNQSPTTATAFAIGNGTSSSQSNALTVNWDGSADLAGDLTVHYSGTAFDVGACLSTASGGGSSTHNYSTTEHAVGTWIDGSTVYEISVATLHQFGQYSKRFDAVDLGGQYTVIHTEGHIYTTGAGVNYDIEELGTSYRIAPSVGASPTNSILSFYVESDTTQTLYCIATVQYVKSRLTDE